MRDDDDARMLLGDTGDVVCRVDREGRFVTFVTGARYEGRPAEQMIGRRVDELLPPGEARIVLDGLERCFASGEGVVVEHRRPSPAGERHVRARLALARDGTVIAHVLDITEEVRARAALRESNDRYRLLAQATTDAVFDWDVASDRATWNAQLATTFGYDEVVTTPRWWMDRMHPADVEAVRKSIIATMRDHGRQVWTGEYRFRTARGEVADVSVRALMLRNADGRVVRVIGSVLDVTEQKALRARLATADRVVALGTLAAGVAHEINNPLNYVVGNVALAVQRLSSSPVGDDDAAAALACLRDAEQGAARVATIVTALGSMARVQEAPLAPVALGDVVTDALKMIAPAKRAGVDVRLALERVPDVRGNAHQLGQVITNLVENALQALDGAASSRERRIDIALSCAGARVVLRVSDTGCGIAPEDVGRIFDPFFTTKGPGGGTGLGLAVVQAIVARHHGEITVESGPGRGTTFQVALPCAPATAASTAPAPSLPCGRLRVLVVDDDAITRRLVLRVLEEEHEVVAVEDPRRALAEVKRADFDVVLCDVIMPGASGSELLGALPASGSRAKFAFLTAGGPGVDDRVAASPCLRKPFTPDALRRFVRELHAS